MRWFTQIWFLISVLYWGKVASQNQASQWYFGGFAGLSHLTNPPAVITNTNLNTLGGMASMSDANGNLMFYTDGHTVWNKLHQVMANGTGLLATPGAPQSVVIVRQLGSNSVFYIWTSAPLYRSIVNMTLAAGLGSVTSKNDLIRTNLISNLAAYDECGDETFLSTRDSTFHRFFTVWDIKSAAQGTNMNISNSQANTYSDKWIKYSPNGNKFALVAAKPALGNNYYVVEIFDRPTPGIWNGQAIATGSALGSLYSCEFSPDGTKLYVSAPDKYSIYQLDLCAGSTSAIANSLYAINTQSVACFGLQLTPKGEIFCTSTPSISIIHQPNMAGAACGFSLLAQSVGTGTVGKNFPNFGTGNFKSPPSPLSLTFTNTSANCNTVVLNVSGGSFTSCSASGNFISSINWNFGDVNSGAANTSTLISPSHVFSSAGAFTVIAIVTRGCRKDTISRQISITGTVPNLQVSGQFTVCTNQSTTISVTGADHYSWGSSTASSVVFSPSSTTTYSIIGTNTTSGCMQMKTFTIVVSPCVGISDFDGENKIQVYPVPAADYIILKRDRAFKKGIQSILFFNAMGLKVMKSEIRPLDDYFKIDISGLAIGLYAIEILADDGSVLWRQFIIKN